MNEFLEIEHKYRANGVTLNTFVKAIKRFKIERELTISGFDTYYSDKDGNYLRHRFNADRAELTMKRRLTGQATTQRIEVDLELKSSQPEAVHELANLLGFSRDFEIYKTCFIFWGPQVNFVYYIVYGEDMNELARFIEIEANKGSLTKESAVRIIDAAEHELARALPVAEVVHHSLRLNKSMFELFTTRGK